jgi:hypothetical protein
MQWMALQRCDVRIANALRLRFIWLKLGSRELSRADGMMMAMFFSLLCFCL